MKKRWGCSAASSLLRPGGALQLRATRPSVVIVEYQAKRLPRTVKRADRPRPRPPAVRAECRDPRPHHPAQAILDRREAVSPHHLRVPDERARLGAHEGHARLAGLHRGRPSRRSRSDPLQHLLHSREGRQPARGPPGRGQAPQGREPGACGRHRRLLVAVDEGAGVRAVPVRRRGLRAGAGAQAGGVPDQRQPHRPGILRVRGLHRPSADEARARVPGLGPDQRGLQLRLLLLHRSVDPRPRGLAAGARAGGRGRAGRLGGGQGDHAAGAERLLLRARSSEGGENQLRGASLPDRRRRRSGAHQVYEPSSQGHSRGRDPRPRGAALGLLAHPPSPAVGLEPGAEGDAPHLRPGALPRARGHDPRARARLLAHHGHHRRLSRGDRG